MHKVDFKDIRTSQNILVKQIIPQNPGTIRLGSIQYYAGKVTEVNNKWLRLRIVGKDHIVPQQGMEEFYVFNSKKDFNKFLKDFKIGDYDREVPV